MSGGMMENIEFIEQVAYTVYAANFYHYVISAGSNGNPAEDLKAAQQYLSRYMEMLPNFPGGFLTWRETITPADIVKTKKLNPNRAQAIYSVYLSERRTDEAKKRELLQMAIDYLTDEINRLENKEAHQC